jgi:hypothetical protein
MHVVTFAASLTPEEALKEILDFFDASVEDGTLEGSGPVASASVRLAALRNMLMAVAHFIQQGQGEGACGQLQQAYLRSDGDTSPPDFAQGSAAATLAQKIQDLMDGLGCS